MPLRLRLRTSPPLSRESFAVKLKAGDAGKAQVLVNVSGKGGNFVAPPTPGMSRRVVMQLLIEDGITTECFKTTFGPAGITRLDDRSFSTNCP